MPRLVDDVLPEVMHKTPNLDSGRRPRGPGLDEIGGLLGDYPQTLEALTFSLGVHDRAFVGTHRTVPTGWYSVCVHCLMYATSASSSRSSLGCRYGLFRKL